MKALAEIKEITHSLVSPENIGKVEVAMLEEPQAECSVTHYFGPGVYIREVRIPAGVFSIGHYQNKEHLNFMVKGKVQMLLDDGTVMELVAPVIYTAKPGRKIGYITEDMVWQNIYPTEETDVEKLEATYLTKSAFWAKSNEAKRKLEYLCRQSDRDDYEAMLKDLGVSHEIVKAESEKEDDQIPMPQGNFNITIANSQIHGKGVFATSPFVAEAFIAPARINDKRTPVGRYTNHSPHPNAKMVLLDNNDIAIVATKNINGCYGGESGEEITVDYRQVVKLTQRAKLCQE